MATGEDVSRSLQGGHEAYFDFPCTLCEEQGKHVEATRYCEDCFVFLCDVCLKTIHNRIPLNKGHKLLDQEKFTTVSQSVIKSFPTKRCPKHPGELVNIYCGNDDVVCCSVCKAFEHSTCRKIQHLPDAAIGIQTSSEYQRVKEETKDFLTDVSNLHAKRTADISRIALEKEQVKETIADFRKKIDIIFDNLEQKSLTELDTREATIVNALKSDLTFLDGMKKKAGEMLLKLDAFRGDNECELFYHLKTGKHFIQDSMKRVKDIHSTPIKSIAFNIDKSIENNLRSVVTVGSYEDVQTTKSTSSVLSTIESNSEHVSSDKASISLADTTDTNGTTSHVSNYPSNVGRPDASVDIVKYDIKLFGKFNVKEKSDTQVCCIVDICQLTDGSILIIDYNNKKLKRLDQSYRLVDSLELPCQPACVCATGPGEAAVSLREEKKIQFVSVGRQLSLTRSIKTGSYCRGMVYIDDKLYVCCGFPRDISSGFIEVYNDTGKLQYSLPRVSKCLLAVPKYITASDDGQHLLVTSIDTDEISMLDMAGNVVQRYNSKEVIAPARICTDGRGQVFVCGLNSYTITQLSTKHKRIDVILTDTDVVLGIHYDRKMSRLLVSSQMSNTLLAYTCSLI